MTPGKDRRAKEKNPSDSSQQHIFDKQQFWSIGRFGGQKCLWLKNGSSFWQEKKAASLLAAGCWAGLSPLQGWGALGPTQSPVPGTRQNGFPRPLHDGSAGSSPGHGEGRGG